MVSVKKHKDKFHISFNFIKEIPIPFWILITFVILIYINTLFNDFTFDDKLVISESQLIKGQAPLKHLFTKEYFKITAEATYRPMVTFSYWLESRIGGMRPFFFHFMNLIYHLIVVMLIYFWLARQTDHWAGLIGAGFWGIHPALSEAVNSIGFREDVLATLFALLSITFFLRNVAKPHPLRFLSIGVFAFLSMLSKESGVMTLPLIILTDIFFLNRSTIPSRFPIYLFLFFVTIIYLILNFFIFVNPQPLFIPNFFGGSPITAFFNIPKVFLLYLYIIIYPIPLRPDWVIKSVHLPADPYFWGGLLAMVLIFNFATKKGRLYLWAVLWFFISMIPVSNIVPILHPFAERYLYLSMIGPFAMLSYFIKEKNHSTLLWKILIIIMLIYSVRTFSRNLEWKNDLTLFKRATKYPCYVASWCALGNAYADIGKNLEAELAYFKAIEIDPKSYLPYYSLGKFYMNQKKEILAKDCFKKYVELVPDDDSVLALYGILSGKYGEFKEAIKSFETLNSLKPDDPEILLRLGMLYWRVGRTKDTITLLSHLESLDKKASEKLKSFIMQYTIPH